MLRALSDYVIAMLELLEAEAKNAQKGLVKLGISLTLVSVAGLLLLAAAAFFVWSLYIYLLTVMAAAPATLICGLLLLVLAGGLLWLASRQVR